MDRNGDHLHRGGEYRHPDQNGPDASEALVGDGVNHDGDFGGRVSRRQRFGGLSGTLISAFLNRR
jgi:hypothetical protein